MDFSFDRERSILNIEGEIYDDENIKTFGQLFSLLQTFLNAGRSSFVLNININFFYGMYSKYFFKIFTLLESHQKMGCVIEVNWYYQEHNIEMLEYGEEFLENTSLTYHLIKV